ncbi:zinc-binding alcohol dehydrogenase family protein [Companilactobacillus allii]|uniref:Quinone oxidoreductase n=1 Tax=Companilactobacillus allii TaxID=1847728 RepID=A0A1P8Q5P2_9LACO|nr:zinc-binding alcohol dehydrogenase family protein [Companilactobacillus allii]APX73184.1 quinone oxidoreductase [Companilactobacillus allii]USQ67992.1 zinc-binding alcohol dehydrogenase family protein [Companilactobacillus allii]
MNAVVVENPGGPEVLKYTKVPTPKVKKGWSLIEVKGFGINHSEIFTREGKSPDVKFPRILGIEAVGVISDSTDVNLKVGQKVMTFMGEMGRNYDGSYAEYVLVPNKQIFPIDSDLDWAKLAAIPETFYTAFGSLTGLQLHDGDHLLIRAGTSGVGVSAAKLAKAMGNINVTSTTRNLNKSDLLVKIGVDNVIQDDNGTLVTSEKFDKILDLMGPKTVPDSLKMLNEYGIVSSTGQLGGVWTLDEFDPIMEIPNNCYLTSFYSGDVDINLLNKLIELIEVKHIDVEPTKVFSLKEVSQAHSYLQGNHSFGKVVVLP